MLMNYKLSRNVETCIVLRVFLLRCFARHLDLSHIPPRPLLQSCVSRALFSGSASPKMVASTLEIRARKRSDLSLDDEDDNDDNARRCRRLRLRVDSVDEGHSTRLEQTVARSNTKSFFASLCLPVKTAETLKSARTISRRR